MKARLEKEIRNFKVNECVEILEKAKEKASNKKNITKDNPEEYVEYIIKTLAYGIEVNEKYVIKKQIRYS